jgi:Putative zinc-finger
MSSWRQYLLGTLPEPELERLEVELLAAADAASGLADAEDGLIEEYLDGALSPTERQRFEEHFLISTEHRRRLDAAHLLREAMKQRGRRASPARPRPVVGAWVGLLAAGIAFVAFNLYRKAEAPGVPPGTMASAQTPSAARPAGPVQIALLSLSPGRVMSAGADAHVDLAPSIATLRLELLAEDASLFRVHVVVSGRGRREVWAGDTSAVRVEGGSTVTVDVPATALPDASSYSVTLYRQPESVKIATYDFTVARP